MASLLTTEDISPSIGCYVYGLDLAQPLSPEILKALRALWLERKVLLFPKQSLTPTLQVEFSRQFGELDKYPFLKSIEGQPFVAEVLKRASETVNFGGVWHSDTAYLKQPAAGASLYAIEVPSIGGDTIFCNMQQAYQTLPEDIKSKISSLKAMNSSAKAAVSKTRVNRLNEQGKLEAVQEFKQLHSVVRIHPETGQKSLFVNEAHTLYIEGLERSESDDLLAYLYQHARQPEFQCRLRWQPGTLVLWDNRSTQHYPINDYTGFRRLLHRVSIKGEVPVG